MTSLRLSLVRFGLATALAVTATATATAETTLKWSLKQGEVLKYAFNQVNDIKLTFQGQENSNKSELNVDLTWTVKSVGADSIELNQVVDRARAKITVSGMSMDYDSQAKDAASSPATEALSKVYGAIVGKTFVLTVTPRGVVTDVKIPAEVTAALAGSPFAAMADSGSFLSPTGVKNMLAQVLPLLPEGSVAQGKTWDTSITLPTGPVQMLLKTKYTLADAAKTAGIDAAIDTSITAAEGAPVAVKVNKQTGTAKFAFDSEGGRLLDSSIKQSFDMTITAQGTDIPQKIEISSSLKLVK